MVLENEIVFVIRPHAAGSGAVMPIVDGRIVRRNAQRIYAMHCIDVEPLPSRIIDHIAAHRDIARAFIEVKRNALVIVVDIILSDKRSRTGGEIVDGPAVLEQALGVVYAVAGDYHITGSGGRRVDAVLRGLIAVHS